MSIGPKAPTTVAAHASGSRLVPTDERRVRKSTATSVSIAIAPMPRGSPVLAQKTRCALANQSHIAANTRLTPHTRITANARGTGAGSLDALRRAGTLRCGRTTSDPEMGRFGMCEATSFIIGAWVNSMRPHQRYVQPMLIERLAPSAAASLPPFAREPERTLV